MALSLLRGDRTTSLIGLCDCVTWFLLSAYLRLHVDYENLVLAS